MASRPTEIANCGARMGTTICYLGRILYLTKHLYFPLEIFVEVIQVFWDAFAVVDAFYAAGVVGGAWEDDF